MVKRKIKNKLIIISAVFFALLLVVFLPKNDEIKPTQQLNYIDYSLEKNVIYLVDQYNYVARTVVALEHDKKIDDKARKLLEILIIDGKNESLIPSGFTPIIPLDTKVKSVEYVEGTIKVNFSKELLDVSIENEDKMIEAIVYTLTSIENVKNVIIYVDGNVLSKLPSGKLLPTSLDRSYGINKEYDITKYKDVDKVTIYYTSKYNDYEYYVPVTKYIDEGSDKINIIIQELSNGSYSRNNLLSYLNSNVSVKNSSINENSICLTFNENIFDNIDSYNILPEVINTISLSIGDNYNLEEVIFNYEDKEIYKSVIKSIE